MLALQESSYRVCDNGSVTTRELEERTLAGTRNKLPTPEIITRFAAALQQALEEAARGANAERDRAEAGHEEVALKQVLAAAPERQVVCLPTNHKTIYRRAVADLDRHRASGMPPKRVRLPARPSTRL